MASAPSAPLSPTPHLQQPPQPPQATVALCLALLLGLQSIASDAYLPALPALGQAFGAPMAAVQLTLSAMILAFGVAQLVWGPLADRVGRRPVLRAGLVLFVLAGLGCVFANSLTALVVGRAAQGAAMAAATVCARATVRDLYEPVTGARIMSWAMSGLGLIAIGGPVLGGVAAAAWGWRGPLMLVVAVGLLALAVITWRLPETLRQRNVQALQVAGLWRNGKHILQHRVFVAWGLLTICTYGMLYVWLVASSFAYMQVYALSAAAYGLTMSASAASYLAGTFVCRHWIARVGMAGTVARAGVISALAAVCLVLALLNGVRSLPLLMAAQMVLLFAHGLHQPCAQAGVTGPFPQAAGTAAALAGFLMALVAFGIGHALGYWADGTERPMVCMTAFWAAATALVAWVLVPAATAPLQAPKVAPV
jgi:MFS transporter, DHA1 family, multidrug resistance protein